MCILYFTSLQTEILIQHLKIIQELLYMLSAYKSSMVQHLKFRLYWEEISWDESTA